METKLLPCPFCPDGGNPKYVTGGSRAHAVWCSKCFVVGPIQATEAEATEAWNARHERTCHVVGSYYDELMDEDYTDLSCGHHLRGAEREFDFCYKCGARIVLCYNS